LADGVDESVIHRVGIGTDVHRLEPGRRLVLGGVEIPFDRGLRGHSDGDVVLHAIIDAMCGAAGLPDIGEQFPDDDPTWRDADSRRLLAASRQRVREARFVVASVDVIIHAESPKLSPHKAEIRRTVAELLDLPAERVSIKAKTNEGLDAVGRGEAIACTAVAGLRKIASEQ
jgi:2-C-methyl-D-erythritol 2,4-cyclodiphosphate synthase